MNTRVLDSWAILEWISGRQPATDAAKLLAETYFEGLTKPAHPEGRERGWGIRVSWSGQEHTS